MADILKNTDPWSDMLQSGIILWRNTLVSKKRVDVSDVRFEPTEKGSFIGRIVMCGARGLWEPEVQSNKIDDKHYTRGIAVFINEIPPAHWTHLIITGVSKPFGYPGKPSVGGCVFARVAIPLKMDDYNDFRTRMHEAQRTDLSADIDQAVEISDGIWPDGTKPGDTRLIVQQAWVDDAYFRYQRIVCPEDE